VGVDLFAARALDLPRPLAVVEDARRGEVHVQVFGPDGAQPPRLTDPAGLAAVLGPLPVTGSAATQVAALTGGPVRAPVLPLAVAIARVAAAAPADTPRPAPIYLRAADAAPPRSPPPAILP
jgi:tRNA A37 threonylcarbamoyladenosine modification protein TsaB